MLNAPRRSAMKVRDGQVQRKNRWARTPNYLTHEMSILVIDRKNPGPGYRHLVTKEELRRFLGLLPNWEELQLGLDAIVLDRGDQDCMGWHRRGVVALCAWERSIAWEDCIPSFFHQHREILDKLEVPYVLEHNIAVNFTEASARAFALVHVLVHELGHHHDRMTTRSRKQPCRGEAFAESYARQFEDEILRRYRRVFEL